MPPLPANLRRDLERSIVNARKAAEAGAESALDALTVRDTKAGNHLDESAKKLRNRLRAHARQLGDKRASDGKQETRRLERECAYEHWHRMIFARFLAENDLLIEPESGVSVNLEDVEELAREQGVNQWELASRYAQRMLPEIFRTDNPILSIALPTETRLSLESLLEALPPAVFTADDSLGWTYQFWQSAEKEAVNARAKSGEKITGETLPAVTQLFTEHYMVLFLLHNTLGAWHAGKVLAANPNLANTAQNEDELRRACALHTPAGECDFTYLRFVREQLETDEESTPTGPWRPAAGTYENWPKTAAKLKVLDPCCGSGHFLVASFKLLLRLRIHEEGLSTQDAINAVLAENLYGLELDPRCTQIAAFNLALSAWKLVDRSIDLPTMHLACSGIGPQSTQDEWLKMAKRTLSAERPDVRQAMERGLIHMHELFTQAPDLGSLIDPNELPDTGFAADFETLQPLLAEILKTETDNDDTHERAVAAQGMAKAAEILSARWNDTADTAEGYTLVITNVPYLGRGSQSERLKSFALDNYKEAKPDLATIFVARMLKWVGGAPAQPGEPCSAGTIAAVTPQNWLFLTSYKKLREKLLKQQSWEIVARLGPGAFETIGGHVVNVALLSISGNKPDDAHIMAGVDVSGASPPSAKASLLRGETPANEPTPDTTTGTVRLVPQKEQVKNPDARVIVSELISRLPLMGGVAEAHHGLTTGDSDRMQFAFWEIDTTNPDWKSFRGSVLETELWGGFENVLRWCNGTGPIVNLPGARRDGQAAWSSHGVIVRQMGPLPTSIYCGGPFDNNTAVIIPSDPDDLPAVWAFASCQQYSDLVRIVDQKLSVTSATLVKIPFDLAHWQQVAAEKYPEGLPEPQSNDPTQWLFHGHPAGMVASGPSGNSPWGIADSSGVDRHPSLICREPNLGDVLQVGVARLLGYRWPAELDDEMRLDEASRAWVSRCDELDEHRDEDGIVCLSPVRAEESAADRLRSLFRSAFGQAWSMDKERALLAAAAEKHKQKEPSESLDDWLRNRFFEEHCKVFHHRPFVWHIWDGKKDGFHALVNAHMLAAPDGLGRKTLESLVYSYLGDWISRQHDAIKTDEPGAEARLASAMELKVELEKILAGEPPYDLFVRWKPLCEQAIGWNPDINDGVRLNIRPFMSATLSKGRKGAGVLRWKPNIKWTKDRGKEPVKLRPREDFPWFWTWDEQAENFTGTPEFDGNRWNGLHYSNAIKQAARERAAAEVEV